MCKRSTPEQWAEWLRPPLEHAARTADYDLVKKLLRAGADGSAGWKGCDGKTLLHAAAEGGDGLVVTALIRAGAGSDVNAKTPGTGHTPLHLATCGGKGAAAKTLIMAGADVNILDNNKISPLHLAIKGGHVGLAENLLACGADPNAREGENGERPIYLAATRGQDEVVLALVNKGVGLSEYYQETPLIAAVLQDHVSTVDILLAGGADPGDTVMGNTTALHFAAKYNKARCIPALIEAGADIEVSNVNGGTPLHYAAIWGSCPFILALLQMGADINKKDLDGYTPLHQACCEGFYSPGVDDAVDLLLRWGADETLSSNDGKTPSQLLRADAPWNDDGRILERVTRLLAHAPQDRAWRRRGFVVMCRALPDRPRLVVEIPGTAAEAIEQPKRARRSQEFRGVAAWLMTLGDEDVFRKIVGFL